MLADRGQVPDGFDEPPTSAAIRMNVTDETRSQVLKN